MFALVGLALQIMVAAFVAYLVIMSIVWLINLIGE
jgi:hypothetical protein